MLRLLLLFVLVPAIELGLLIELGRYIGTLPTLGVIVVTGILGAFLARQQGLGVLRRMRQETAQGRMPAGALADGVMILLAGAVLMTPGLLTDTFGFLLLVPAVRRWVKAGLLRRIERSIREGNTHVTLGFRGPP